MADKEVLLTALNIKAMSFTEDNAEEEEEESLPLPASEANNGTKGRLATLAEKRNPILGTMIH